MLPNLTMAALIVENSKVKAGADLSHSSRGSLGMSFSNLTRVSLSTRFKQLDDNTLVIKILILV